MDYEKTYDERWRALVENADGSLNVDQIKRELHDFSRVMDQASKVYSHIADLSKANTAAVHIISAHDEAVSNAWDDGYNDGLAEQQ